MPRRLAEKRMAVLCQLPTVWPDPGVRYANSGSGPGYPHNRQRSPGTSLGPLPVRCTRDLGAPWHFLYFLPEPQGRARCAGCSHSPDRCPRCASRHRRPHWDRVLQLLGLLLLLAQRGTTACAFFATDSASLSCAVSFADSAASADAADSSASWASSPCPPSSRPQAPPGESRRPWPPRKPQ